MTKPDNLSIPDSVSIDPHHLVFAYCESYYRVAINSALHERPLHHRARFFRRLARREPLLIERSHLLAYLDDVSSRLSELLKTHSPYFWLFIYRRIKAVLSPRHDNITDVTTVLLVRQILELAIAKYGSLDIMDFAESSQLPFDKQWGGYLKLAIEDQFASNRDTMR
jgi:hypothetical protein